tara:strand:- start:223 stop:732 length:510 start_codon:yes stop_codon:yes gene_type:complete
MLKKQSANVFRKTKLKNKLKALRCAKNQSEAIRFIYNLSGVKIKPNEFVDFEFSNTIFENVKKNEKLYGKKSPIKMNKKYFIKSLMKSKNNLVDDNYYFKIHDVEVCYVMLPRKKIIEIMSGIIEKQNTFNYSLEIVSFNYTYYLYIDYYYDPTIDCDMEFEFVERKFS